MAKAVKIKFIELGAGGILYLAALYTAGDGEWTSGAETVCFLLAYFALAAGVFAQLIRNFRKMHFFDENFLMLLATVGALIIGKYTEAVGAILFFQIGKLIEEISMSRTKKSIAKYMDIRPEFANRKVGNKEENVAPSDLKRGDVIVIRPGEKIPVDAVVTAGSSMVDMKALTGESEPGEVKIGRKSIQWKYQSERTIGSEGVESICGVYGVADHGTGRGGEQEEVGDREVCRPVYEVLHADRDLSRDSRDDPAADDAAGARYGDVDVPGTDFPRCRLSVRATRVGSACISRGDRCGF